MSGNNGCEKCGNTIGFAFGTCCNCGWNYLQREYTHIRVDVKDLSLKDRFYLTQLHDERITKMKNMITENQGGKNHENS